MTWKRARTEDKKTERKEMILRAALALFKKNSYEGLSFNGIAFEAGFTKSNMYRYFSSKEEIFLNIFSKFFQEWVKDYIKGLKKLKEEENTYHFAETWTNSFNKHNEFLDLMPILFVSLEKNSSYEQLYEFKKVAKALLYKISLEITRIYPDISVEMAFNFLNLSYAATSSFWSASTENEALKRIYEQDIFKNLKIDFEKDISNSIEIIIKGIRVK